MKKPNTIFTKLHADLLRFISKSLPNKTSRYDAFMYLLENQIELINQYKNGSNAPRHYTILGLSNKWKWDRKNRHVFPKIPSRHGRYQRQRRRFWHHNSRPTSCP